MNYVTIAGFGMVGLFALISILISLYCTGVIGRRSNDDERVKLVEMSRIK
jgi:threonine dehydrogenase-like Zn-dependent dehydrogenase